MTTQLVKQTLENENELLAAMIDLVEKFNNPDFTEQAKFIQESWARFLKDRYNTNDEQFKMSDAELKADFLSEISQIGAYIHVTSRDPQFSERWLKFLVCERDISGYLYNKVD